MEVEVATQIREYSRGGGFGQSVHRRGLPALAYRCKCTLHRSTTAIGPGCVTRWQESLDPFLHMFELSERDNPAQHHTPQVGGDVPRLEAAVSGHSLQSLEQYAQRGESNSDSRASRLRPVQPREPEHENAGCREGR